jgi:hypothetical protein
MSADEHKNNEIKLALIEHASRPFFYALVGLFFIGWLLVMREPLSQFLLNVSKVDAFGVLIERSARESNVTPSYENLKDLTDEQVALFLAIGGKRTEWISYSGPEVTPDNLRKLQEAGLLTEWHPNEDAPGFTWTSSPEAQRLHAIIVNQLIGSIKAVD